MEINEDNFYFNKENIILIFIKVFEININIEIQKMEHDKYFFKIQAKFKMVNFLKIN